MCEDTIIDKRGIMLGKGDFLFNESVCYKQSDLTRLNIIVNQLDKL